MSAWTCRQLSERSPKRSFHLVFESHDGTAYVPIPERSTSLRATSTPPVVDSQKRLTPNGRLEKRTYAPRTGAVVPVSWHRRSACMSVCDIDIAYTANNGVRRNGNHVSPRSSWK